MCDLLRGATWSIQDLLFSSVAYLEGIHTCTASQNMPWSLSILQGQGNRPQYTVLFVALRLFLHLHCSLTSHSKDHRAARPLQSVLYKQKKISKSCLLENISGFLLVISMKLMKVSYVKYLWINSYLYRGCRWKWRMIIAVNFPT